MVSTSTLISPRAYFAKPVIVHCILILMLLQTSYQFMDRLEHQLREDYPDTKNHLSLTGYVEAPLAYDAVWALALALDKAQKRSVSQIVS